MQERPWIKTFREYGIAAEVAAAPHASVTAMLEAAMQRYATKTAFVSFGQRLSFADVDRALARFRSLAAGPGGEEG
jgi:long-chain acyl-CoA synthetase